MTESDGSTGADGTGDATAAWRPFVDGLRGFVARRVPDRDADDVAQEVLIRLHQGAGSLRDAERAESWVYGIARRAIADYYRSRGARREVDDPEVVEEAPGADSRPAGFGTFRGDHDVHEEVLTWLRPTAEELPDGYREALLLADFEGLPQREVAQRLGLTLSGAKSRVQRARRMLGDLLLKCCEIELDAEGRVTDFRRRECDC